MVGRSAALRLACHVYSNGYGHGLPRRLRAGLSGPGAVPGQAAFNLKWPRPGRLPRSRQPHWVRRLRLARLAGAASYPLIPFESQTVTVHPMIRVRVPGLPVPA